MPPDDALDLARKWVPGGGTVEVERLGKGLVNESFRVVRDARRYALRVPLEHAAMLGVDRDWERLVLAQAQAADLGPVVERCDPTEGVLVTRWLEGVPWSSREARSPGGIETIAELARRIHSLPIPVNPRAMSPKAWVAHYQGALTARGVQVPASLQERAAARLAAFARLPAMPQTLCHSDLHVENLVGTIERPRVLDWEYAHVGEALWDVAGWISNNDFDAELAARLLASYLQLTPSASVAGRLCELIWLYQYVCWLWSKLYLNLHCGTATAPLAARTEILMARLEAGTSSGRIGQVPAH